MAIPDRLKIVSVFLMGAAGLPFLFLAFCQHPMGLHEWDWITGYPDEVGGMSFGTAQLHWYQTVMGRFVSTAFTSLTPYWYTLSRFQVLIALLLVSVPLALYSIIRSVWGRTDTIIWTAATWIAYLSAVSGVYDSLFRYTSLLTYQVGLLGWLIWLAAWRKSTKGRRIYGLIAALALVVAIGCNEVTLTLSGIVLGALWWYRRQSAVPYLVVFSVIALFLGLLVLMAPGNFSRVGQYASDISLLKCTALLMGTVVFTWLDWLTNSILVPVLLIWTVYLRARGAIRQDQALFQHPYLWLLSTLVVVPLGLFLVVFGTKGASFPERVVDLLFLPFMLGAMGTIQSWMLYRQKQTERGITSFERRLIMALAAYALVHTFFNGLSLNRDNKTYSHPIELVRVNAPVGQAWLTVISGAATAFDRQMNQQYTLIAAAAQDTIEVPPPLVRPALLYDSLSDRRWRPNGELYMGRHFNRRVKSVRYQRVQ